MKAINWTYLGRQAALLLVFSYVLLFGGGFAALVDFRLQLSTSVVAIVVLGGWLAWRMLKKERLPLRGLELAIMAFVGSQFLAAAFSEDPRRSLPMAITWLVYALVFFLVTDLLRRGWPAELFETSILIIGAMVLAFALLELTGLFLSWRQIVGSVGLAPRFQQRLSGILGDPNLLAAFTNLLLALALARALVSRKATRWLLAGFAIAGFVVLYFTDSRGGFLGFAAGFGILVTLWTAIVSEGAKRRFLQVWAYLRSHGWILVLLMAGILLAVGLVAWRMISFQGDTTHAPALEARDIYWQAATKAFSKDPVTGVGPGMYPVFLMQIWSTPPARPYLHAHSFPFQVAAESGLVGLAALAWLVFVFSRQAWVSWRELDMAGRARWAAALAALVGLGVHSLVDDFFPFPAVGVTVMLMMALVTSPQNGNRRADKSFALGWLLAPGLAAAIFSGVALSAYMHADRAIAAGTKGDWSTAAEEMQAAARLDPELAIYHLQAGYAEAMLGRSDPDFHKAAIVDFSRGIDKEPYYSLSRGNLGMIYWQNGDLVSALQEMRIATSLAPEAWQFWLQQGIYEEALGFIEEAQVSYRNALGPNSEIGNSVFWLETELRSDLTALFMVAPDDPLRADALAKVDDARQNIVTGQFEAAEKLLSEAYALNDQEILVYVALGELSLAQGQLASAQAYVDEALWIQATRNQSKVEAILLAAEIAHAGGDQEAAERFYISAYDAIMQNSSYGWGSAGWSPYAWFVFQRNTFPEDLLPGYERADITMAIAERLMGLAELYEEQGLVAKAKTIRSELATYLP